MLVLGDILVVHSCCYQCNVFIVLTCWADLLQKQFINSWIQLHMILQFVVLLDLLNAYNRILWYTVNQSFPTPFQCCDVKYYKKFTFQDLFRLQLNLLTMKLKLNLIATDRLHKHLSHTAQITYTCGMYQYLTFGHEMGVQDMNCCGQWLSTSRSLKTFLWT